MPAPILARTNAAVDSLTKQHLYSLRVDQSLKTKQRASQQTRTCVSRKRLTIHARYPNSYVTLQRCGLPTRGHNILQQTERGFRLYALDASVDASSTDDVPDVQQEKEKEEPVKAEAKETDAPTKDSTEGEDPSPSGSSEETKASKEEAANGAEEEEPAPVKRRRGRPKLNRTADRDASEESTGVDIMQMPAERMEGVAVDIVGMSTEEALYDDNVYNHELSWMSFNWRVLAMAIDENTPLWERLRFLAITARNLDEFFAKRVGGLKRQQAAGVANIIRKRRGGEGKEQWTPATQLGYISNAVTQFVGKQTEVLLEEVLPALREEAGVFLIMDYEELTEDEALWLREWFVQEVEPLLTPLAIDPGHPFPFINSLSINLAIVLSDPEDADESGEKTSMAIVTIPSSIPRCKELPERTDCFVTLEQVIIHNLDRLFGGMEIRSADCFIATRNADVERNEEEAEDLLDMMTDEVRERRFAPFVRLEVQHTMDSKLVRRLQEELGLVSADVYPTRGLLALGELDSLQPHFAMHNQHEFPHWAPMTHLRLTKIKNPAELFRVIRRGDVMLHHPYHSFATSTQLLVEAASVDPQVKAIKCTLYRTSSDSPIINALIAAAERGIQVAVLVELKARFDEARNVGFATKLEDAGCNVAYGLVGLKTHCKTTLVVREESGGQLMTYCHIGTGNYNPRTAAVYTDMGLLTANREVGEDVMDLFKYLTGYHRQRKFRKLLVAPTKMRQQFVKMIEAEIAAKEEGLPAGITAKVNGLDDAVICAKLYEASQAGVPVTLIVRGICKIRPGVKGLSENITVISIIGRFLEHHRIFRFENAGSPLYYIGSADWMTRNLMRRVEVATPIEDPALRLELQDILDGCIADAHNAWHMQTDGTYIRQLSPFVTSRSSEQADAATDKELEKMTIPELSALVGTQSALMTKYETERRKFKKKSRKATQVVRRKGSIAKASDPFSNPSSDEDSE